MKNPKNKKHDKMYHLLGEMRKACHILWKSNDPKALEAWHILFDAHNDTVISGIGTSDTHSAEKQVISILPGKKNVELMGRSK